MKIQLYLLNRTYIAEDKGTGLLAYGSTEQVAIDALTQLVNSYWEEKKIVVPINQDPTPVKK